MPDAALISQEIGPLIVTGTDEYQVPAALALAHPDVGPCVFAEASRIGTAEAGRRAQVRGRR